MLCLYTIVISCILMKVTYLRYSPRGETYIWRSDVVVPSSVEGCTQSGVFHRLSQDMIEERLEGERDRNRM